jgi:regulator of protease activity HflC (stomatin/prohibitin superfamily)
LIQNNPDALNIIDVPKLMKMALEDGNIPTTILKSDEQMAKEAEQRAQQQQAQSAQEGALAASQIIKNTGMDL